MPALAAQVHGPKAVVPMEMPPPSEGTFLEHSPEVGQAGVSLMQAAFTCVAHRWMRWMT